MGLTGGVFNNGIALSQHRSHHNIHGSAHAHHIEVDVGTLHTTVLGTGGNIAALHADGSAHGGEALDMLVDGTDAKVAATGHGDGSLALTTQQCAQQIVAGADAAGQIVTGAGGMDMAAVDLHSVAIQHADTGTQLLQHGEEQRHIADLGNILNAANAIHQQCCGDDAHGGVLRAGDGHLTEQGAAATNHVFIQS